MQVQVSSGSNLYRRKEIRNKNPAESNYLVRGETCLYEENSPSSLLVRFHHFPL